jgi:methylmalonyl-CoA/ethylmalonyl-CoA epimerase
VIGPLAGLPVVQLGFVVRDIDAAVERFGAQEWERFEALPDWFEGVQHRGQPAQMHNLVALGGTPSTELIQAVGPPPSTYLDWLEQRGEGLHHVAVEVEDMDETIRAMEAAGYPLEQGGTFGGDGRFAYFDTLAELGIYVEALRFPSDWAH